MVTRILLPAELEHVLIARDCVCDAARTAGVADQDLADLALAVAGMTGDAVRAHRRAERRAPVTVTYGQYADGTYRVAIDDDAADDARLVRNYPLPHGTTADEAVLDDDVPSCPLAQEAPAVAMRLARDATAVPQARRFVVAVLYARGYDRVATIVELLASELVTNTAMHTSGGAELTVTPQADLVRVEVSDRSSAPPVLLPEPPIEDGHGRGLLMVDALASGWGHTGLPGGKVVWFAVPTK